MDVSVIKEFAGAPAPAAVAARGPSHGARFEDELERVASRRPADERTAPAREAERDAQRSKAGKATRDTEETRHDHSGRRRANEAEAGSGQAPREATSEPDRPTPAPQEAPRQPGDTATTASAAGTDMQQEAAPEQDSPAEGMAGPFRGKAAAANAGPSATGGSPTGLPAGTPMDQPVPAGATPEAARAPTAGPAAEAGKQQPGQAAASAISPGPADGAAARAEPAADPRMAGASGTAGLDAGRGPMGEEGSTSDIPLDLAAVWKKGGGKSATVAAGDHAGTTAGQKPASSPTTLTNGADGNAAARTAPGQPAAAPATQPTAAPVPPAISAGEPAPLGAIAPGDGQAAASVGAGHGNGAASQAGQVSQAAPARIAAPGQAPTVQVAIHMAKAVQDGQNRITIRLDPPELGRVDVKLDVASDGRVIAVVAADRQETLDLLQRDARSLERALQDAGLEADGNSLSFSLRQHDQEADPRLARGRMEAADGADGLKPEPEAASQPIIASRPASSRALDISI